MSVLGTSLDSYTFEGMSVLVKDHKVTYKAMSALLFEKHPEIASELMAELLSKEKPGVTNPMTDGQKQKAALARETRKEHMGRFKATNPSDEELQAEKKRYDAAIRKSKKIATNVAKRKEEAQSSDGESL